MRQDIHNIYPPYRSYFLGFLRALKKKAFGDIYFDLQTHFSLFIVRYAN